MQTLSFGDSKLNVVLTQSISSAWAAPAMLIKTATANPNVDRHCRLVPSNRIFHSIPSLPERST